MRFEQPLLFGTLIRRFNRFFAEIELEDRPPLFPPVNGGENRIVAHCPNTGSMKGVNVPGARVAVSYRVLPTPLPPNQEFGGKDGIGGSEGIVKFTWQMIQLDGDWVGINTMVPNRITAEALEGKLIPAFRRYASYRKEVPYGGDSRIDFALGLREDHLVEVKNVTLVEGGLAKFPDCVSERATKHLHRLMHNIRHGGKSSVLFVIQHHAAKYFGPADDLDPVYGKTLRQAVKKGMKIEAWKARVTPEEIRLSEKIRVNL